MAERHEIVREVIEAELRDAYVPGQCDCFMLALKVADGLNGTELFAEYRGAYSKLTQVDGFLENRGFSDFEELFESHFKRKPPAQLYYGDIAIVQRGELKAPAVCFVRISLLSNAATVRLHCPCRRCWQDLRFNRCHN